MSAQFFVEAAWPGAPGVAWWLGGRVCNPEVSGSNPPPCHWMDLCLVSPEFTPPLFVNSQLNSLPRRGSFNKSLFKLHHLLPYSMSTVSTALLNTSTPK